MSAFLEAKQLSVMDLFVRPICLYKRTKSNIDFLAGIELYFGVSTGGVGVGHEYA